MMIADAMLLFSLPLLSIPSRTEIDLGPVRFLRQHLGLERFYTFGPVVPNYANYFQVASLNYNLAIVPASWSHYASSALDPGADTALFIGSYPPPMAAREAALRSNLAGFEDAAVKYVLVGLQPNPLAGIDAKCVYRDNIVAIFELPDPSDYFEVRGGPCQILAKSRQVVSARCDAPAVLSRRELFYSGWRASLNGRETAIRRSPSIFQTLNLPKGDSIVVFSYRPSHLGWATSAALLGLGLLCCELIFRAMTKEHQAGPHSFHR